MIQHSYRLPPAKTCKGISHCFIPVPLPPPFRVPLAPLFRVPLAPLFRVPLAPPVLNRCVHVA